MLPLTEADEQTLLRLARQALEEGVRHHRLPDLEDPEAFLAENCGAFVTLHKGRHLRGCIGYVEPAKPLGRTVQECAQAAALRDPRFEPVTADELPSLRLEISLLSPLEEVPPHQIQVGKHGLLVSRGFQRGLLLPQVAVEHKWDRDKFLEEACLKAGLPRDGWRQGATLQVFTARVFSEPPGVAPSVHHAA